MQRLQHVKVVVASDAAPAPLAHHGHHSWTLQDGRVTFSQVFTVAVIVLLGMLGLKFIAPWYDYLRLKGAMQESVNQAQLSTDEELMSAVQNKAKELKVTLASRNIHVERSGQSGVRLWAEYDVQLTFPLGFSHTQIFRPDVGS